MENYVKFTCVYLTEVFFIYGLTDIPNHWFTSKYLTDIINL